ncbi:MAG: hypothetical protein LQ338_005746, partial [Usnochroma carphineum]
LNEPMMSLVFCVMSPLVGGALAGGGGGGGGGGAPWAISSAITGEIELVEVASPFEHRFA